jgi:hypothetical protein
MGFNLAFNGLNGSSRNKMVGLDWIVLKIPCKWQTLVNTKMKVLV